MTDGKKGVLGLLKSENSYNLGQLIFSGAVIGTTMKAVDAGLDYISVLGSKFSDYRQKRAEIKELELERKTEKMAELFSEKFIERLKNYFETVSKSEYG